MMYIQVFDEATNAVYDIFGIEPEEFDIIFSEGTDIAFIDEVVERENGKDIENALSKVWKRRTPKRKINGLHGILFYGFKEKKEYYPNRRDEDAVNPDGTRLR